jgi:hypothetical protein
VILPGIGRRSEDADILTRTGQGLVGVGQECAQGFGPVAEQCLPQLLGDAGPSRQLTVSAAVLFVASGSKVKGKSSSSP